MKKWTKQQWQIFTYTFLIIFVGGVLAMAGIDTSNNFRLGDGQASNKTIEFNRGLGATNNPKIRWNQSQLKLQFSNDGTNFTDIGSGGGGGGSVTRLQLSEVMNFIEKLKGPVADTPEFSLRESFIVPQAELEYFLLSDITAAATSFVAIPNPKFLNDANKDFDGATGWTAISGSDASSITTSLTKQIGTNSLQWAKAGGTATDSAIYLDISAAPIGLSDSREAWYYINLPSTTNLMNVGMRFSSDAIPDTNFREIAVTTNAAGGALATGWNLIVLPVNDSSGSETGTGWDETDPVNSIAFVVNTTSGAQTYAGLKVDSLVFSRDNYLQVIQKGDTLSVADGTNLEEVTISSASANLKGTVTTAAAFVNNYAGGTATKFARTLLNTASGTARIESRSGAANLTQPIRLKKNLTDTVSGTFFDVSVSQSTPLAFYVTDVDSTSQIKVSDALNNSAQFLTGDKYYVFNAVPSGGKYDYIYRALKLTLSNNASFSGGKITLQNSGTNAGVAVGDLIVKEDIETRASMVALGANEVWSSPLVEQKMFVENLGVAYPKRGNLLAHWTLSGTDGLVNKAGPLKSLTQNGTVADGIQWFYGLFSRGIFSQTNNFSLSVADSALLKSDVAQLVTHSVWFYVSVVPTNRPIFSHYNASNQGYQVGFDVGGALQVANNGSPIHDHTAVVGAGAWHHLVTHFCGASCATAYICYDGACETFTQGATDNTTSYFQLGSDAGVSADGFPGYLSQAMVWNTALSTDDVQYLFNTGKGLDMGDKPAIKHVYQTDPLTGQKLGIRVDAKRRTSATTGPTISQVSAASQ